ncbi:MAG: peptidylprolyl isomerase [Ignavibacteriaceae bacterium]
MKSFFLLFALSFAMIFFNCSDETSELLKTTYQRNFNKAIISKYLHSENPEEVKAALLSVSHSEDTSFIPMIKQLDFKEHAELFFFAIGQIGKCTVSTKFLWFKVYSDDFYQNSKFIFEAIGKTGTETDLEKVSEMYANFDGPVFPFEGISLAIRQFAFRGIKSDVSKQILIDEATNQLSSIERKSDAIFTLARIGSTTKINNALINILKSEKVDAQSIELKQYALMNFRTQKYFPEDEDLVNTLLNEPNILLQIEAAKTLCYKRVTTKEELNAFLSLIDFNNPNVTTAAATSLRNIHIENEELNNYLKNYLLKKIYTVLPPHTLGELIVSMVVLFPHTLTDISPDMFDGKKIPAKYFYDVSGYNNKNLTYLNLLVDKFSRDSSISDKISILSNLLKFQISFPENENLRNVLMRSLTSENAPLVSVAADGVDSIFIIKNSDKLKNIILIQVERELNNPDFIEAVMSMVNLSEKIDDDFYKEVIEKTKISTLYSLRKFISDKTGINYKGEKDLTHYYDIVNYSLKYKSAEIKTDKDSFVIEFLPGYAPISVGNFCKLAEEDFYNGIEFHRIVPGFVIQAGDPSGTGWGGPGYDIISEFSPLPYEVGMVGMASAGKDTEGSQFFVMQGNYPHLNGRYSLFAKVTNGFDVVYKLEQGDKINSIQLMH